MEVFPEDYLRIDRWESCMLTKRVILVLNKTTESLNLNTLIRFEFNFLFTLVIHISVLKQCKFPVVLAIKELVRIFLYFRIFFHQYVI